LSCRDAARCRGKSWANSGESTIARWWTSSITGSQRCKIIQFSMKAKPRFSHKATDSYVDGPQAFYHGREFPGK
jgi:hypothetical protein